MGGALSAHTAQRINNAVRATDSDSSRRLTFVLLRELVSHLTGHLRS